MSYIQLNMPRKRKTSADCDLIREYQRNWLRDKLKNDPEYKARHYASKQKRVENNRKLLKEIKENSPCSACGEYHPTCCMDHHHLDPSIKEKQVSKMIEANSWTKIEQEIGKCILVCSNCHRKIHAGLLTLVYPSG
jgi:hypothetical protein